MVEAALFDFLVVLLSSNDWWGSAPTPNFKVYENPAVALQ